MGFQKNVIKLLLFSVSMNLFAADFTPISQKRLFEVHEAIFDAFIPFTYEERDTTLKHLLEEVKLSTFEKLIAVPRMKGAFFLLDHLHLSHNKAFLKLYYNLVANDPAEAARVTHSRLHKYREFVDSISGHHLRLSIRDLSIEQRLQLFNALINANVNLLQQVGFYVRMLYTQAIFEGALGEKISNYVDREPKVAAILPSLPALKTHLRLEKEHCHFRIKGKLDALIIGSGASGSVIAHEMQKNGLKVLVVESGPLVIPGSFDTTSDMRFMEGGAPRLAEDGSIALLNGAVAGGGTTVNLDMSFPPSLDHVRHRFHQWHEKGLIPAELWADNDIDNAYAWVQNKFQPRTVSVDEVNENNRILIEGANNLGLPHRLYELNTYAPNTSPHEVSSKKSSLDILLLPAMLAGENPTTLLTDCRVTRVLKKHGRAVGVECMYQPKHRGIGIVHDLYGWNIEPDSLIKIYADNVILAAGNLGTSAILLNSKIDNDNIGKGYVAHPFVSFMGRFAHPVHADIGEPSTVLLDHFMQTDEHPERPGFLIETGLGRLSLWALLVPGLPSQVKDVFSTIDHVGGFSVMQTDTPNDENRVEVDIWGTIKVHYQLSDTDRRHLIEGIKTAVKLLFAAGALEVSFNTFEYPLFQDGGLMSNMLTPDMNIDEVFTHFTLERNKNSLLGAHMMGGNRIGTSALTSVVDENYQVWGVLGLYVADASVFPGSVGANPMSTIYTTAKIFVDKFLAKYFEEQKYALNQE